MPRLPLLKYFNDFSLKEWKMLMFYLKENEKAEKKTGLPF